MQKVLNSIPELQEFIALKGEDTSYPVKIEKWKGICWVLER